MVQQKYESVSYKTKIKRKTPKEAWIVVEGTHEPIIDKQLWETVQEQIRKKAKPSKNGKIGVFARKVKCQCCKYTLRTGKKNGKTFYRCLTNSLSTGTCTGAYISHNNLENAVLHQLRELIKSFINQDELLQKTKFNSRNQRANTENKVRYAFL